MSNRYDYYIIKAFALQPGIVYMLNMYVCL